MGSRVGLFVIVSQPVGETDVFHGSGVALTAACSKIWITV